MDTETIKLRLQTLEQQLQQTVARATQLREALDQAQQNQNRLEGACGVLRELLEPAPAPIAEPISPNGSDPLEPAV